MIMRTAIYSLLAVLALTLSGSAAWAQDEYGNTPATAFELNNIDIAPLELTGVINGTSDIDVFELDLAAPGLIRVDTTVSALTAGSAEIFFIGDADEIATAESGGGITTLERVLPAGIYYIAISADTGTPDYEVVFGLVQDLAGRAVSDLNLVSPAPVVETTNADGTYDIYGVMGPSIGLFAADLTAQPMPGEPSVDLASIFTNDMIQILAANDDGPMPPDSAFDSPLFAGQHWLFVKPGEREAGGYRLDYALETPVVLPLAGSMPGTMEGPGDVAFYSFTLNQMRTVRFTTLGEIDTAIVLYDGVGSMLGMDDDSGIGFNASLTRQLGAGTYYLGVSSVDGVPGAFSIDATESTIQTIAAPGATVVNLTADGEGTYQFDIPISDNYIITVTGPDIQLNGTLLNAFGAVVAASTPTADGFTITTSLMPATYFMQVESLIGSTGQLTIDIVREGATGILTGNVVGAVSLLLIP